MSFLIGLVVFLVIAGFPAVLALRSFLSTPPKVEGIIAGIGGVVVGIIAAGIISSAVGQVNPGERGVVVRLGAVTGKVLGEGFYIVTPVLESVEIMDVKVQAPRYEAAAASKDLQDVATEVTPNWHINPERAAEVYQQMRREVDRVVVPAVQEAVKATTAKYDAEELITRRAAVREDIAAMLRARFEEFGLTLDALSITQFKFTNEFSQAIEAKVTATQQALKAENDLRRIKTEAEQRIAQAKAEAEAIRIQAQSIAQQGGASYVALKAVEKWDGHYPQTLMSGKDTGVLISLGTK